MRVLFTLHHHLDPNLGAPGATLALGAALEVAGCKVEYFGFEKAFIGKDQWNVSHAVRFPSRTALFLKRHAHEFEVIDASTGDAWLWAFLGRPCAQALGTLITRSHGLEHIFDEKMRMEAKLSGRHLSWKYPLYHGGFRLWEVTQSLRRADRCILLNKSDKEFAKNILRLSDEQIYVISNGISDTFIRQPQPFKEKVDTTLRLTFLGSWLPRKGIGILVEAVKKLWNLNIPFTILILGTGNVINETEVQHCFPSEMRKNVQIISRFKREDLSTLLIGQEILLFPSLSEGFSLALIEAMACGLAPIATSVGGAPDFINSGINGILVPPGDADAIVNSVKHLASNPDALLNIRYLARQTAQNYGWDKIASQTIMVYEDSLRKRAGQINK